MRMGIKEELRKKYKLIRGALDESFRQAASADICARIASLEQYKAAKTLMCYSAINSEVILDELIDNASASGKRVLLPVTDSASSVMYAARFDGADTMVRGSYGIDEPADRRAFDADKIDIVIVPALVYNRRGFRIGYGKGCYDRFFSSCGDVLKIGAAYSCQLCEEDFGEAYDVRVDMIVTQEGVVHCAKKEAT